eukprot:scaffold350_cov333-Pavlova_lutheri.AAC.33
MLDLRSDTTFVATPFPARFDAQGCVSTRLHVVASISEAGTHAFGDGRGGVVHVHDTCWRVGSLIHPYLIPAPPPPATWTFAIA